MRYEHYDSLETRAPDERERLADILLHQEHGHAVGVDRAHGLEDPSDQHRRQAERRLVQHQQPRPRHQRAPDRAHLLLASGE